MNNTNSYTALIGATLTAFVALFASAMSFWNTRVQIGVERQRVINDRAKVLGEADAKYSEITASIREELRHDIERMRSELKEAREYASKWEAAYQEVWREHAETQIALASAIQERDEARREVDRLQDQISVLRVDFEKLKARVAFHDGNGMEDGE